MKTSRLLASLFGAAVMAVMAVGCNKTDNPDNPNKPGENTTDTLPVWGISKLTVNAEGGAQEVEFEPTGDWTFVSKTDWLTVGTASGTKVDRLIKFTAKPNTTFAERTAETVITVDGVAKDLKIVQKAAMRYIKVYSSLITFAPGDEEAIIPNIYANVDFEVSAKPTWVKSVELNKVDTVYEALVTLNPADFDDEDRTGVITFKDKASDYAVSFTLKCDKNSADYVVTKDEAFDFPFESITPEELKANFTVSSMPGAEDYILAAWGLWHNRLNPTAWCVVTETVAPAAAYSSRMFNVALEIFERPQMGDLFRVADVYMFPVGTTEDEQYELIQSSAVKSLVKVTQNVFSSVKLVSEDMINFTYGVAATKEVKFKVRTGVDFNISLEDEDESNRPFFTSGKVTFLPMGDKTSTGGWDTYTYQLSFPNDISYQYSSQNNKIVIFLGEDDQFDWNSDEYVEFVVNALEPEL